jgi:hypothetical protein
MIKRMSGKRGRMICVESVPYFSMDKIDLMVNFIGAP